MLVHGALSPSSTRRTHACSLLEDETRGAEPDCSSRPRGGRPPPSQSQISQMCEHAHWGQRSHPPSPIARSHVLSGRRHQVVAVSSWLGAARESHGRALRSSSLLIDTQRA